MDNLIGKRAYKKTGFMAKLIGIIDHKDEQFNSYIIKFRNNTGVMASFDDMVILEDEK